MDNQEFFDLYMADTSENLGLISQNILYLESDTTNTEYIKNIFRAAHTIKGAAASMEFVDVTNVTHKLEDLFGAIRDNKIAVSTDVIDVVFKSLDCLELLHEQLLDPSIVVDTSVVDDIIRILSGSNKQEEEPAIDNATDIDVARILGESNSRLNTNEIYSKLITPDILSIVKSLDMASTHIYYLSAAVDDTCEYKGVRMFMFLDALASLGEVVATTPDAKELESDSFDGTVIDILLISDANMDDLSGIFNSVLEIQVTECIDISYINSEQPSEIVDNHTISNVVANPVDELTETEITIEKPLEHKVEDILEHKEEDVTKLQVLSEKQQPTRQKMHKDANLYVRVHTKTLDTLLNEQGELLLEYNRLCSVLERGRKGELSMAEMIDVLDDVGTNINKINSTQQSIIMSTRMFPLEQLFTMFPRMIRDLSANLHKKIELIIEGQDTELDRTILEKVSDPLKHIIRNAVDHGIEMPEERVQAGKPEKGTVVLSAKQESDSVIITVKDDGKGMDPEVLKRKAVEKGLYTQAQVDKLTNEEIFSVIFMAGFSTASHVTEVSGRGVGMDIVKSSLSEIGGVVFIDSKLGVGTTFTVKIPLTLAISQALLVTVEKEKYIVLLNYIQEVTEINRERDIKRIQHKDHIVIRGEKIYPLIYLREVYGYPPSTKDTESVILISNNGREIGLVVDGLLGQQDIVVKSLNKYFGGEVKYEAGITKLGDGSIPIIVDVPAVMEDF